jgi:predicted nucleic acid-binding protein
VVVDTNILAYLLIEGDRTRDVHALFARDANWKSAAFVRIEFSNILAAYLRANSLTRNQAHAILVEAEKRPVRHCASPDHVAAMRAAGVKLRQDTFCSEALHEQVPCEARGAKPRAPRSQDEERCR